jgi:hypothetical protein
MLDPLGPLPRPSDHGPDEARGSWECAWCGCKCSGDPARLCSQPNCFGEICESCEKTALCEACQEPYCIEHLKPATTPENRIEVWCSSCISGMTCERCGEIKDDIEEYDYGTERETGYHDAGRACGDCREKR